MVLALAVSAIGCAQQPAPRPVGRGSLSPTQRAATGREWTPAPEPPKPLADPPKIIRGVYLTSWSAGLKRRIDYIIDLAKRTDVNAVVIDIKDYSGYLAYRMSFPEAQKYGAVRVAIRDIDNVVNRLHAANIYAIARITCFQDPILARARPDLAVHRKSLMKEGGRGSSASTLWLDRKGLAWLDPAAKPAWDYMVQVARDALKHGFDELNFDYIRFPSDGDLKDMQFPVWDGKTAKAVVIRNYFQYLRRQVSDVPISADVFGLATVNEDDLGIGQVIESAYSSFDAVCPMVYPSHYAHGFDGFQNPAEHPYEVVKYSLDKAISRLRALANPAADGSGPATEPRSSGSVPADPPKPVHVGKLRPWLQEFNLGGKYDAERVGAQIRAVREALGDDYAGYLIWSPSNVYPALLPNSGEAALKVPNPSKVNNSQ